MLLKVYTYRASRKLLISVFDWCLDSVECGMVKWNSGTMEYWNGGRSKLNLH